MRRVKAERENSQTRYYNETVFRSAERLAASRPPAKRSYRGVFFASGLALGVLAGVGGREIWVRMHPATETPAPVTSSPARVKNRPRAIVDSSQPAAAPAPVAAPASQSAADTLAPATDNQASPANATGSVAVTAHTVGQSPATPAVDETFAATLGLRVAWYGVLSSSRSPMRTIEFSFGEKRNTASDRINGVVRIGSVTANVVVGDMTDGSIVLREIDKIWTKSDEVDANDPLLRVGRKFVIPMPDPAAQELNGTWSLADENGTLKLSVLRRADL